MLTAHLIINNFEIFSANLNSITKQEAVTELLNDVNYLEYLTTNFPNEVATSTLNYTFLTWTHNPFDGNLKVESSAIQVGNRVYALDPPQNHSNIRDYMVSIWKFPKEFFNSEPGFILTDGRFVDREVAKTVALMAGQLITDSNSNSKGLVSADLWSMLT